MQCPTHIKVILSTTKTIKLDVFKYLTLINDAIYKLFIAFNAVNINAELNRKNKRRKGKQRITCITSGVKIIFIKIPQQILVIYFL